jgi:endoglucanase
MTPAAWNDLSARALEIIRGTNPERTVIVAALNIGEVGTIKALKLPKADRNLIVTVHYYDPFHFTHQGASWDSELAKLHDIDWGSAADKKAVTDDFALVARWAKTADRPIYLGEFGAYEGAPMAARARYADFLARTAEGLGWPWAWWQFDHDFALYDQETQSWVAPLLAALIPKSGD